MNTKKGFGLIGILITLAIIVGITGSSFYFLQNIGTVQTPDGENESINSVIQQAEDVKQKVEERNKEMTIIPTEGAESTNETEPIAPTSLLRVGKNMIYVADQPYRPTLIVNVAYLSEQGYIVIFGVTKEGTPRRSFDAWSVLLTEGEHRNVEIGNMDIYDGPLPFNRLIAMLYKDDGDGYFDDRKDVPVTDDLGNPIWMLFNVNENAPDPRNVQINF